jgi:hypothetical protein
MAVPRPMNAMVAKTILDANHAAPNDAPVLWNGDGEGKWWRRFQKMIPIMMGRPTFMGPFRGLNQCLGFAAICVMGDEIGRVAAAWM